MNADNHLSVLIAPGSHHGPSTITKRSGDNFWKEFLDYLIRSPGSGWKFHPVRNIFDRQQALHLVYREYARRGYIRKNPLEIFFHFHSLLPHAAIFVATNPIGQVGATLKLIPDHPDYGLPADKIFPDKLQKLRARGRKIGEVGMLALDPVLCPKRSAALGKLIKMKFLGQLYRLMFIHSLRTASLDEIVIMVHSRHTALYEAFCFAQEGEVRTVARLNDAPAVFMRMDILHALQLGDLKNERFTQFFFPDEKYFPRVDEQHHLNGWELEYFLNLNATVGWLNEEEKNRLQSIYAECDRCRKRESRCKKQATGCTIEEIKSRYPIV